MPSFKSKPFGKKKEVLFFAEVCEFVSEKDNSKTYGRILMKFSGYVLPWRRSELAECQGVISIKQLSFNLITTLSVEKCESVYNFKRIFLNPCIDWVHFMNT